MRCSSRWECRDTQHRGPQCRTREQLHKDARLENIRGRSRMNKQQLERALAR